MSLVIVDVNINAVLQVANRAVKLPAVFTDDAKEQQRATVVQVLLESGLETPLSGLAEAIDEKLFCALVDFGDILRTFF